MEDAFIEHWRGDVRVVGEFQGSGFAVYDSTLSATDPREPGRFIGGSPDLGSALTWAQADDEFVVAHAEALHQHDPERTVTWLEGQNWHRTDESGVYEYREPEEGS